MRPARRHAVPDVPPRQGCSRAAPAAASRPARGAGTELSPPRKASPWMPESPRDEFDRSWQPRLWITLGLLILIGALPDRVRRRQRQRGFGRLRLRGGQDLADLGDPAVSARRPPRRRAARAARAAPSAQERGEDGNALLDLRRRRVAERQAGRLLAAADGKKSAPFTKVTPAASARESSSLASAGRSTQTK